MTTTKKTPTKTPTRKVRVFLPSIAQTRALLKIVRDHENEMPGIEGALREAIRRAQKK